MNRGIPNRPHPTPNPDKPHAAPGSDRSELARTASSAQGLPTPFRPPQVEPRPTIDEEPSYDSVFDDLNAVLSQSMQEPDPDPNLIARGATPPVGKDADVERAGQFPIASRPPRTSEIFRSVVATSGTDRGPVESPAGPVEPAVDTGIPLPELADLDSRSPSDPAREREAEGPPGDNRVPWGQIVLLSYSSALTLALIWMFGTGRFPRPDSPDSSASEKAVTESPLQPMETQADTSPPPLPAGNLTTIGKTVRLGDIDVTPLGIVVSPVDLVRTIAPGKGRREHGCLILRLRFTNRSKEHTFAPTDLNTVRERDLRTFDPYIATSSGPAIRLFPLALNSEWTILGQKFPLLQPGETGETFVASEPGSVNHLADEMTWRVRLRTGVYRIDMLGVKFTRAQVAHAPPADDELDEFE